MISTPLPTVRADFHSAEISYAFGESTFALGHFAEALLDQFHPQRRSQRRGPSGMAALLRATAASRLVRGRRCDPRSAGPCPGLRIVRRLMIKLTRQYVDKPWGRDAAAADVRGAAV